MRLSRLLSILFLVALLFAPVGMLGSHAAMAMPQADMAIGMDHCAGEDAPSDEEERSMPSCSVACAAVPAEEFLSDTAALSPMSRPAIGPALFIDGVMPEASAPPPRLS